MEGDQGIRRPRLVVWVGRALVGLGCSALLGWMTLAIYFDFSLLGPPWLRAVLGVLVPVGAVVALFLVSWKLFLNGCLDELAYDIGAIDRSLPFPVLKAKSYINERAKAANDDPRFSVRIREGLPRMSLDRGRTGVTR